MVISIIGGGLSGLSLGLYAKEKCNIYEKENYYGGLCRSKIVNDHIFDTGGSHIIFSRDKKILEEMISILNNDVQKNKRNTIIQLDDCIVKYPIENGLYDLSKETRYDILKDFFSLFSEKQNTNFSSFKEYLIHNFGKTLAYLYLIPYNEKVWNEDLKNIGIEWTEGRLPKPNIDDIIKSCLGISNEGYTHQLNFYYPLKGGIQKFIDNIYKSNIKKGNEIFLKSNVTIKGDNIYINDTKIKTQRIISTIPLRELSKIVLDTPENIIKKINKLKINGVITFIIGLNGRRNPDKSWLYFPYNSQGPFNRIAYLSNYSIHNAPKDQESILVEITYDNSIEITEEVIKKYYQETIESLEDMGYFTKDEILFYETHINPYGYVVYNKGYEKPLKDSIAYFQSRGIEIFGRFAEFKYYNMDNIIENSRKYW